MGNKNWKPKAMQLTGDNVTELLEWMNNNHTSIISNHNGKTTLTTVSSTNKLKIKEGEYVVKLKDENNEDIYDVCKISRPKIPFEDIEKKFFK
jgi:methyl coenzyme M reductase subunit D